MTKWAILLSVPAAAALPVLARGVRGEDGLAVREVHARIVDAYNHEDTDRLTEHLHPDVAYLIPSRPAIEGKDAVRAMYEGVVDRFSLQGRCLAGLREAIMSTAANKELVRRFYEEVVSTGDTARIGEFVGLRQWLPRDVREPRLIECTGGFAPARWVDNTRRQSFRGESYAQRSSIVDSRSHALRIDQLRGRSRPRGSQPEPA
jgi:hypothetical protein